MLNNVQIDLLKKHVGPFLFCFTTLMFVLLMQFLILHVDKLVGKGLPLTIVIELILNNLAYMVVLAAPMAVLVSTLIAFGKFSEWNELTAIRAAGINPIKLIIPVIGAGFILFIFMGYFSNYVLPESNHKARSLFIDIRTQKPAFDLQPSTFYHDIEGYTFWIKEINSQTDSLYDIRVFQEPSDTKHRTTINAERGWLESPNDVTLTLYMLNGSSLRIIPGANQTEATIERSKFDKYRMTFDLSELSFSRSNPSQRSRTDRTMSAEAMLAVVDSLNEEKANELEKFKKNISQSVSIPFHFEPARMFELDEETVADTLQIFESRFAVINELPNPTTKVSSLNRAMSVLDKYRPELESLETNLSWRNTRIAEFMIEVHKKLSIPFACVIFVLVGAPIGMLTKRGNLGFAAIISSILLTIYFLAVIQGEKLADRQLISPFMGMWGINIFYLLIGIILILHVSSSIRITKLFQRNEKA